MWSTATVPNGKNRNHFRAFPTKKFNLFTPDLYASKIFRRTLTYSIKSFFLYQAPFGKFSFSLQRITSLMSTEATENERVEPTMYVYISTVTNVEFHSLLGEIQELFINQWAYSKDLKISCKTFWVRAIQIWAHFYWINSFENPWIYKCRYWKLFS